MTTSFGSKLIKLRKLNNVTQNDLADALNVSRSTISHYEKDKRVPDYNTINKLAGYFCVDVSYFFNDNHGKKQEKEVSGIKKLTTETISDSNNANKEIFDNLALVPGYLDVDFIFKVTGDHMTWVGIYPGDTALIKKSDSYNNESIIAVFDEGKSEKSHFRLYFLIQKGEKFYLKSANPKYEIVELKSKKSVVGELIGIVKPPPTLSVYYEMINEKVNWI